MLKRIMTINAISFLLATGTYCNESDFITYDWLLDAAAKTGYTEHIPHFRRLFNTMKVRGLLECGCGYSTKYFMDNCEEVTSIEFMTGGTSALWYNECLRLYKDCPNWVPILYNEDLQNDSFDKACGYQCSTHRDYALIDPTYLFDLDQYFKERIYRSHRRGKDIDVAFVDAGVYIRGDMVKLLIENNVPVVVAHDTATDVGTDVDEGLYGWFKVKTPPNYEKICIPNGAHTTFWINKKFPEIIQSISAYRDEIVQHEGQITFEMLTKFADQIENKQSIP